ncbi:hypothetical protein RCL1_004970 [Eukaryota sp. TZLM3-RCL]
MSISVQDRNRIANLVCDNKIAAIPESSLRPMTSVVEAGSSLLNVTNATNNILFLGLTGSGKSTMINLLAEVALVIREGLVCLNSTVGLPMSGTLESETRHPQVMKSLFGNLVDVPGFRDNRGHVVELANNVTLKRLLTHSKGLVIVLVLNFNDFFHERGLTMRTRLNDILSAFSNDFKANSLFFVLNKCPPTPPAHILNTTNNETVKQMNAQSKLIIVPAISSPNALNTVRETFRNQFKSCLARVRFQSIPSIDLSLSLAADALAVVRNYITKSMLVVLKSRMIENWKSFDQNTNELNSKKDQLIQELTQNLDQKATTMLQILPNVTTKIVTDFKNTVLTEAITIYSREIQMLNEKHRLIQREAQLRQEAAAAEQQRIAEQIRTEAGDHNILFCNLPPTYTKESLQNLLSACKALEVVKVKDSRFVPNTRVGIVSCKDQEMMSSIIEQFNGIQVTNAQGAASKIEVLLRGDHRRFGRGHGGFHGNHYNYPLETLDQIIIIGNLNPATSKETIKHLFDPFGVVQCLEVQASPFRHGRIFAKIVYETSEAANNAILAMDGYTLDSQVIKVSSPQDSQHGHREWKGRRGGHEHRRGGRHGRFVPFQKR